MSDLGRDLSNPHSWESGVAMGVGLYYGAKGSGLMPKAQGRITNIPSGAKPINVFPTIRNGHGFFGNNALIIRNYKIESMYRNGGGGTIFSIKQMKTNGNLFRVEYGIHPPSKVPYWHYHSRVSIMGKNLEVVQLAKFILFL